MTTSTTEATLPHLAGRRRIDAGRRPFAATMRNDFLTPQGRPYKWQEMTATIDRTLRPGGVATVVPVRYEWQRVTSRTGDPSAEGEAREWTFARGQSFDWMLLHAAADLDDVPAATPGVSYGSTQTVMDIRYPQLPRSPAVDLLLMLSWDVVTFEMWCTHLLNTPGLGEVGGRAELDRISGSWANLQFSDPAAVAVFRNSRVTAQHLGLGRFAGRPASVYSSTCLDCPIEVRSGPMHQRGRSSYWATLQVDAETGELLSADMTEMIVATLKGADGRKVPVAKRRTVRMWVRTDEDPPPPPPAARDAAPAVDPALLAEAIRLSGRVADYAAWQVESLEHLPAGMADLARMGFRSVVGSDLAGTYRQIRALRTGLQGLTDGEPGAAAAVRAALPEHRRHIEGLLAFGQLAIDGAERSLAPGDPGRTASRRHMTDLGADLTELLALLGELERPPTTRGEG